MTDFIAEVCSNHNNDLSRALTLIDTAKEIGCTGVKFQLFKLDKLYAPEALNHPDYQFLQARRAWELPLEWLPVLANRARQRGIKFGCTPFYLEAVDELLPYVDFYKIASYSLLHDDLLVKVAKTGKPVILSTGMATITEIEDAVAMLFKCQHLTLLHCVSEYPANTGKLNPRFINRLGLLSCSHENVSGVGWSDHTVNPAVVYYFTLVASASMVEFHLDLDGQGVEYGIGHCWLPRQAQVVIQTVREVEAVHDSGANLSRLFSEAEQKERLWRADPGDGLRPLKEKRGKL